MQDSKNWINMFDAIFYINMEKSVDRRKHIEKEFGHFSGKLIRINAITPEILGEEMINSIIENNKHADEPYRIKGKTRTNQNEISLGLSHAKAVNQAIQFFKETGKSKILIIEDDAVITELDTPQKNQLGYVYQVGIQHDIWQLGYTIFNKNAGAWLTEREYSIKCRKLPYGCARVEKGIFGTLGYAINLNDNNIDNFERFVVELSKGSISDYCLSEQKYLKKIIYHEKLLMPLAQGSTISNESSYSVVENGYSLCAFKEGFVKDTENYDQTLITCYRENYENRLAYLIVEPTDLENTVVYTRKFFEETIDDIVHDGKDLYEAELKTFGNQIIKRAFIVIFDNLSKPNLGKRFLYTKVIMQKELIIKDHAVILQIVSMRNKETGLYVPTMDGNVNLNLNRIYNQIQKGELTKCYMTLPHVFQIDGDSLNDLQKLNSEVFNNRIEFIHTQFLYGKDVGETRVNMMRIDESFTFENTPQIISNFPISFKASISLCPDVEIIYDYSLTKLSDDDTSPSAKFFQNELALSEEFETYLFSDIQIDYWSKYSKNIGKTIFRSSNMLNPLLVRLLANKNSAGIDAPEYSAIKKRLDHFSNFTTPRTSFFPSRIDDPRYQFERIVKETIEKGGALIISNPTSVSLPTYLNPLINEGKLIVFDESLSKRILYFYILKNLIFDITHYEEDMHLGLIEQCILSDEVICQFTSEQINSYIYNGK